MGDLVGGRYPQQNALQSILGLPGNASNAIIPVRSNLEYTGLQGLADTAAELVTAVMTVVPVPVDIGQPISKVSALIGATAAGTPVNQWAALYKGTNVAAPPLIGQSTDGTTAAIAASARYDFTLASEYVVLGADAPYGYLFAAIMVKATTVPSLITVPVGAAAGQYAWWTNFPGASFAAAAGALAFSAGSALTATAPSTLVAVAAKTTAPVVFLS